MNCYFYNNTSGIIQVASTLTSQGVTNTSSDGGATFTLTTNYVRY